MFMKGYNFQPAVFAVGSSTISSFMKPPFKRGINPFYFCQSRNNTYTVFLLEKFKVRPTGSFVDWNTAETAIFSKKNGRDIPCNVLF